MKSVMRLKPLSEDELVRVGSNRCPNGYKLNNRSKEYGEFGVYIPCRKCEVCIQKTVQQYVSRVMLHSYKHKGIFLTLTYDDEHLPMNRNGGGAELSEDDVAEFLSALKVEAGSSRFRYVIAGEYGSTEHTNRPHYHALIFGFTPPQGDPVAYKDFCEFFEKTWGKGAVTVDPVKHVAQGAGGIRYVLKYQFKSQFQPLNKILYKAPEFFKASTRWDTSYLKQIGEDYREKKAIVFPDGLKLPERVFIDQKLGTPDYRSLPDDTTTLSSYDPEAKYLQLGDTRYHIYMPIVNSPNIRRSKKLALMDKPDPIPLLLTTVQQKHLFFYEFPEIKEMLKSSYKKWYKEAFKYGAPGTAEWNARLEAMEYHASKFYDSDVLLYYAHKRESELRKKRLKVISLDG